jgi:hypothetical protein
MEKQQNKEYLWGGESGDQLRETIRKLSEVVVIACALLDVLVTEVYASVTALSIDTQYLCILLYVNYKSKEKCYNIEFLLMICKMNI